MIGTTVSHYKILEKLGEGGMGVVYKAQDTRLDRFVALKFLPPHLAASEQDKARFIQEAKSASALNHPNVCTIHDIQEHEGQIFIVMEYVDGQTLADKKGTIGYKQAIEIGIQVAEGLGAAHEKGIVHRDIKPDNIMVRKDGIAQIMDFGLAKLQGVSRLTKAGSTVGTAGYMSPEQVQGLDADHRSDIFSFGVLMFELLTGQLPFNGVHETALAYEIVNVDSPPMSSIKPEIAPELDAVVLECLEKDPNERTQSIRQVAVDLKRYRRESSRSRVSRVTAARPIAAAPARGTERGERTTAGRLSHREIAAWSLAGLLLIAAVLVTLFPLREPEVRVIRSSLLPPDRASFNSTLGGHIAVSPNGRLIAFVAIDSMRQSTLWVRSLNALSGQQLNGTDEAQYPFWSPDSRFIGFFAGGKLKKVEVAGGPPQTICDAAAARGGAWNRDGVIVFAPLSTGPLFRVPSAGGIPAEVTVLDSTRGELSHRWPQFLPDGNHFLFSVQTTQTGDAAGDVICVGSVEKSQSTILLHATSNAAYASGYLLFQREQSLMAQPFDAKGAAFTGEAFPIAEHVHFWADRNKAIFTVSDNGILAYQSGSVFGTSQLVWFDRNGREIEKVGNPGVFSSFKISPDERSVAFDQVDMKSRNTDIWIYDMTRKVQTRFTFDPSYDIAPLWSPDGNRIIFASQRGKEVKYNLYERPASGASNEELLLQTNFHKMPTDWSRDGKYLLYTATPTPRNAADLWILPLTGPASPADGNKAGGNQGAGDRKAFPFLETDFNEARAAMSPDGRWIAYQSNESGAPQIYVRPFPGPGGKYQVSTTPGTRPRWRKDGKELYYLGNDNKLMAAEVTSKGPIFVVGAVRVLFETRPVNGGLSNVYDVTGDGKRFLINTILGETSSSPVTLVVNWNAEIKPQ